MRVLITGAGGQLGHEVAAVFGSAGHHQVTACSRHDLDLLSRDSVLSAITSVEPDVVIHCGAYTAVDQAESDAGTAFAVNALGTRHVVAGAEITGAQVVYVSTDYVFDGKSERPYVEWDATAPLNVYGASKLAGESECRPTDAICRTSWVFGAQGSNILKTLVKLARGKDEVSFVDDQFGKPTWTRDLAQGLYQVAINKLAGIYHLTNEGQTTWFELAREVFRAVGEDPARVHPIGTSEMSPARAAIRPRYSVLDNFAWRTSGFKPLRDHREAIQEVVKEMTAQ